MALRTPLSVTPHLYMGDSTGRPLDNGVVYFGQKDKDPEFYPITLYSDDALTLPLMQPVHTKGGYLYDKGDMVEPHAKEIIYSVKVLDSYGRKVFYKGAMMRNSWNDDVIEQINTAILEAQAETAAIAGQVAANAVDSAITDIVAAGASQNGWTDLLIATANGSNQREVNKKTVFEYDTVAAMLADTTIVSGKVVSTNGYHTKEDGGGAKYTISSIATDYSIPLANGLHAVFNDKFDIRKFGIRDSATLNQDVELLRMRNYADTREYVIDFHGFSIMSPKLNPNMSGGSSFSIVRGLWFTKAHHFKNLKIFSDKINRQNSGICQLVFCPDADPISEEWVVFENITLDPWSDNYQPFTENYVGAYDGMRHGIFIHPKGGWNALFNVNQKDYATNYCFKFINIEFLSSAYSYNITTAGIRSREVIIDGYKGDSILAINMDCVNLYARNFTTNTRYDLLEAGRAMVLSGLHFEAEHSGASKTGLIFNYENIYLENCSITRVNRSGVQEGSGQLLWFTAIGESYIRNISIKSSSGNVEIQCSPRISAGTMTLNCDNVLIKDCLESLWFGVAKYTNVKNITYDNSVINRIVVANSYYPSMITDSKVDKYVIRNESVIKSPLFYGNRKDSKIGELILDRVVFEIPTTSSYGLVEEAEIGKIVLSDCTYPRIKNLFRRVLNLKTINISNVTFTGGANIAILSVRYSDTLGKTNAILDNIIFTEIVGQYTTFNMAGTVQLINYTAPTVMKFSLPVDIVGDFTAGINTIETNLYNINSPVLNTSYTLTDSVAANSSVKKTYAVNKDCKYAALSFSLPTDLVVGQYRQGDNIVVTLTNNTSSPITLASNILTVKQII